MLPMRMAACSVLKKGFERAQLRIMIELLQYRAWALSEAYFDRMYEAINRGIDLTKLVKKKEIQDYHSRIDALLNFVDPDTTSVTLRTNPWTGEKIIPTVKAGGQNIALIPIIGPLTKYGDACSMGMQEYSHFISTALQDEKIHGLVLIMDTPGGTVDGTPELASLIKNASKPVGVFGDGMVASAGVWIASQADVIVGNKNNPTAFGSIGVLMVNHDYSNVVESGRAPKMTIIRAPGSDEKALLNPIEPMTDELLASVKEELKSIREEFVSTVKAGRGERIDAKFPGLFTGQMLDLQKAKSAGLIDSIGNLSTAINKVAEMVREKNRQGKSGASAPSANTEMKFPKLSRLFSGEAWNKVASAFAEDQAPLEATEQKVAELEANLQKATEANDASTKKIAELEKSVSDLNGQVSALTAEKATLITEKADLQTKLDKKPAGHATTSTADEDPGQEEKKSKYRTSVDDEVAKYQSVTKPNSK
jgi:protease-4